MRGEREQEREKQSNRKREKRKLRKLEERKGDTEILAMDRKRTKDGEMIEIEGENRDTVRERRRRT